MCGDGGDLARVVGLDASDRDQGVTALIERVGGEVFELAGLVAAKGQSGVDILTLGPDFNVAAEMGTQSIQALQGRGAEGEGDPSGGFEGCTRHGTPLLGVDTDMLTLSYPVGSLI
jgi:hypothetical protein